MNAEPVLELAAMPALSKLMSRVVTTLWRRPGDEAQVVPLALRLAEVHAERAHLARYREVCGFPDGDILPVTYPQVLATRLLIHLLTRPQFPWPVPGLVHLTNSITALRPLVASRSYAVELRLQPGARSPRGVEFEVTVEYHDSQGLVWQARIGLLRRGRGRPSKAALAPVAPLQGIHVPFSVPAGIGRRYAQVTGDFNPIHLSRWSAHLFGFRAAIAHGMWTLARSVALIEDRRGRAVTACEVSFKRPLYLPTEAELCFGPGNPTAFSVVSKAGADVHLTGALR